MMSLRMRKVCADDADFLYRIMNDQTILDALDEIPTQISDWTEAISAWESDPDEEDYMICDDETPIGWLGINGLQSEDKTAYIKMIGLLPQYQNRGIGAHALRQILDVLKSRGFAAAALYTNQDNYRAQKCYAKCGFQVTEELVEQMNNGNSAKRYRMQAAL